MSEILYKKEVEGIVCFSDDMHPYNYDLVTCPHQEAHEIYRQWIASLSKSKRTYKRRIES